MVSCGFNNENLIEMKIQIENLRAQMRGVQLNGYQRALALDEYYKLLDYVEELEKLTIPAVMESVCCCSKGKGISIEELLNKGYERGYNDAMKLTDEATKALRNIAEGLCPSSADEAFIFAGIAKKIAGDALNKILNENNRE